MKSWKTTVAGIAGVVAAIASAVHAQFDGDPATVADWTMVIAMLAGSFGLLLARDNDKTSEQAGALVLGAGAALIAIGGGIGVASFAFGGLATAVSTVGAVLGVVTAALGALLSPIGLVVTAVAGLGAAILIYSGAAGDALDWLGKQFGRLRRFVGDVVGGITDALAAGDIALAAKVLWAGLKVAWETGIAPLRKAWESFRYAFEKVGINAFASLKKAWLGVSNWMWKNFPETTAFIAKTWVNLASTMMRVWARFQNWLSDRWLEIMGLFDEDLDVGLAKKLGREDLNAQLNQIEADRRAALAEADRKSGRSDAEREAEHAAALAGVEAQRVRALAGLDKAHADRVVAAEQALGAAKAELAKARQQARKEREQADAAPGAPKPGGLADLEQRVKAAGRATQAKISVVGTFNAAAALGLAGSGVFDRAARAAEQTAKNTNRLLEVAQRGGPKFA